MSPVAKSEEEMTVKEYMEAHNLYPDLRQITRDAIEEAIKMHSVEADPVRAMFWAAALTALVSRRGNPDHDDEETFRQAHQTGDRLWEEWKKAHEPE